MDFFNKLTQKTSEVYQGAKEKTVKLSEEIKLKNKISDLKSKIDDKYLEIGKAVYASMQKGEDASKEEIAPKCEEITKFNEEIEKVQADILALKNIKKCVKCGVELDSAAEFCSKCGTAQPKVEEVKVEVAEEPEKAEEAEVTEVKDVEAEDKKED